MTGLKISKFHFYCNIYLYHPTESLYFVTILYYSNAYFLYYFYKNQTRIQDEYQFSLSFFFYRRN